MQYLIQKDKMKSVLILFVLFSISNSSFCQDSSLFSKDHHISSGFRNPDPGFKKKGFKELAKWMIWDRIINDSNNENLDTVKFEMGNNDPKWLQENTSKFSITWIGHSSLLIQMEGLNILTDPVWGERASPVSFYGPERFVKPGLAFKDLPKIDVVLITHDHTDHLDLETIKKLGNKPFYIISLGLAAFLEDMDITNFQELDWGDEIKFNQMKFTCVPAQHFSGRTVFNRNKSLWSGFIITGKTANIYFAGDTGYNSSFKKIGKRYGPFDVAAIPIGAYMPRWFMKSVHVDPREALDIYMDIKAKYFIPIHWGTFQLADEPVKDPPKLLMKEVNNRKLDASLVKILKHGETFILPQEELVSKNQM